MVSCYRSAKSEGHSTGGNTPHNRPTAHKSSNTGKGVKMPSFQARHYVAVARVLNKHWKEAESASLSMLPGIGSMGRTELDTITRIGDDFMRMFAQDNPRFDNTRFYDAVKTGKGI
jgi:hypothetical protein